MAHSFTSIALKLRSIFCAGIIFSLLLQMHPLSSNGQIDTALASQLQQILDDKVQSGDHGVSACVIMPDGSVWKGVSGVGAGGAAISDSTIYHGASTTKAQIATLILMLAEDGLLSLDSPWTNYVNLNVNFDPAITIRQLLNHTSGIADYLETAAAGPLITNDFSNSFNPYLMLQNVVPQAPLFAPGTNFAYSTSNYMLAAFIAEMVSGSAVEVALRNRIWQPLGMNDTYFGGFEYYSEPKAGVWWDFGSGLQDYSSQPTTSMLTFAYGGANIVSTPSDLAKFVRALFTDTLLSQASMNEMLTFVPQSYASWTAGYGLGIHNADAFGTNSVLGHDGYYTNLTDMFHSYDYGFTLVTMTNTPTQWYGIFNPMYIAVRDHLIAGVPENKSGGISISPNPATDGISVNLDKMQQVSEIYITDILGTKIFGTEHVMSDQIRIDTRDFLPGVYFVNVRGEGRSLKEKIIVTR